MASWNLRPPAAAASGALTEPEPGSNGRWTAPGAEADITVGEENGGEAHASLAASLRAPDVEALEEAARQRGDVGPRDTLRRKNWEEDDTTPSWRRRRKHVFVVTDAGKPVYARHGDEARLAGFAASLAALSAYAGERGGQGAGAADALQCVSAGRHRIVFLRRPPLLLVAVATSEEPVRALQAQLELMHAQILSLLTTALERAFARNAALDMRPLLAGAEAVLDGLAHSFSHDWATLLHAFSPLPLPAATRSSATQALARCTSATDAGAGGALCALLLCNGAVVALAGGVPLHPDDVLLVANLVRHAGGLRSAESFTPFCLPHYTPHAFLYVYIQFLSPALCCVLLSPDPGSFFALQGCRVALEAELLRAGVVEEAEASAAAGGLRVEDLPVPGAPSNIPPPWHVRASGPLTAPGPSAGPLLVASGGPPPPPLRPPPVPSTGSLPPPPATGLLHFLYRSVSLGQFVASEYAPALAERKARKRLFRAYQRLHASLHTGQQRMQYRRECEPECVLLAWRTPDFELYAALDALVDKNSAVAVCNRVCQWLRALETDLFLVGPSMSMSSW